MSIPDLDRTVVTDPAAASPAPPRRVGRPYLPTPSSAAPLWDRADPTMAPDAGRARRTRLSGAWLGVCTVAVALVALIVFMLQNTRGVEVTFLWMHGTAPLAVALLTAGVAVAIVAVAVGQARIGQLRRAARRQR
jgi:uncharacterized integral membrane protein